MNRRLAALYAMAEQDVSPEEAKIARAKLETMGAWPPPPPPPTRNAAAPMPQPRPMTNFWTTFSSGGGTASVSFTFVRHVTEW